MNDGMNSPISRTPVTDQQQNTVMEGGEPKIKTSANIGAEDSVHAPMTRKDRRMAAKKEKRKKKRKELARREEEDRLNDPEEQMRIELEEAMERERFQREMLEFDERERRIMEEWEKRRAEEKNQEERRRAEEEEERHQEQNQADCEREGDSDNWEYVEEGPPEIIWHGNEIIVKKKKVKVKKKDAQSQRTTEDQNRPTSNPFPPEPEPRPGYVNGSVLSAQELLESVSQETPNFGTEQDKAHCPFHLKTGACRFGTRCSRIHFYPDKSSTLLMKNMYNGPGLVWELDEGLECTDEEVERAYEEFYDDVHTEFLKYGEILNFKVCKNGSPHLRGNVYVHYKSLESAVQAYQSINGRYFAGKQVLCEFVGVTRWKVAICGEFMKSKLRACSRGRACNFIHCFRNPGGDYEWADWDNPPPRYWVRKLAALFGTTTPDDDDDDDTDRRNTRWHHRGSSRSRGEKRRHDEEKQPGGSGTTSNDKDSSSNGHSRRRRRRIRSHREEDYDESSASMRRDSSQNMSECKDVNGHDDLKKNPSSSSRRRKSENSSSRRRSQHQVVNDIEEDRWQP